MLRVEEGEKNGVREERSQIQSKTLNTEEIVTELTLATLAKSCNTQVLSFSGSKSLYNLGWFIYYITSEFLNVQRMYLCVGYSLFFYFKDLLYLLERQLQIKKE